MQALNDKGVGPFSPRVFDMTFEAGKRDFSYYNWHVCSRFKVLIGLGISEEVNDKNRQILTSHIILPNYTYDFSIAVTMSIRHKMLGSLCAKSLLVATYVRCNSGK